jgi:membrane protein
MSNSIKALLKLFKAASVNWIADRAQSMGAALAFYTIFSIAPLLLIVIAVASPIFGEDAARGEIQGQLQGLLGDKSATAVRSLLESASPPGGSGRAVVFDVVLLCIGATNVFAELQDSLDRIWRVPQCATSSGLAGWARRRLLSFGMILCIGFLLIVSLASHAGISALSRWWGSASEAWAAFADVGELGLGFALVMVVFALIYKTMPRAQIAWRDVWVGAAVTAMLLNGGTFLIGQYIGHSAVSSAFGAAASLIVVLLWVYYSAQIFLFGAEFTRVYAHQHGSRRSTPMPGTVPGPEPTDRVIV